MICRSSYRYSGPMKPTTLFTRKGSKRAGDAIGARFERQLIDAVVRFGGERATLAGFEIHHVLALPGDVAPAMVFQYLFSAFAKHRRA